MKKIFIVALVVIVLVIVVLKVESSGNKSVDFTVNDIASELLNTVDFEDTLDSIDSDMIPLAYDIDKSYLIDYVAYSGTGATAEEICVFNVHNIEEQMKIYDILLERIEKKRYSYSNYMPNEVSKIDNAVLIAKNNFVVLCISNDDLKARQVITKYL